jgi:transcription factor C subunit 6
VDWLEGRWMKGKIPYHSVENIRGDDVNSDAEEVDGGEEDELEEED